MTNYLSYLQHLSTSVAHEREPAESSVPVPTSPTSSIKSRIQPDHTPPGLRIVPPPPSATLPLETSLSSLFSPDREPYECPSTPFDRCIDTSKPFPFHASSPLSPASPSTISKASKLSGLGRKFFGRSRSATTIAVRSKPGLGDDIRPIPPPSTPSTPRRFGFGSTFSLYNHPNQNHSSLSSLGSNMHDRAESPHPRLSADDDDTETASFYTTRSGSASEEGGTPSKDLVVRCYEDPQENPDWWRAMARLRSLRCDQHKPSPGRAQVASALVPKIASIVTSPREEGRKNKRTYVNNERAMQEVLYLNCGITDHHSLIR